MTLKKLNSIFFKLICLLALYCIGPNAKAQFSSIFTEDFEGCGVGTLPICSWNETGTGSRWTTANDLCTIAGLYSLAVGSDANFCEYNRDFGTSDRIAYTQFSTSGFQQLEITFDWKCLGETGIDFGTVVYSNDGVSWNNVSLIQYQGSIGSQSEINLPIPAALDDDPTAFIGFRWVDNNNTGGWPGFTIDNINIIAEQMVPPDPDAPVSSVPVGCDSVELSWGGLPPSPSNVVWYWQDSVCGTDTNIIGGGDTNFTVYTTGTYFIRAYNTVSGLWSVNCDSISVIVDGPPPVADAGASGTECDLNYVFSAVPSVGSGQWSLITGPGTAIFNDTISPNDTVTVSSYGTYVFMWTEVNGSCSDNDTVTVTFSQQPISNAGLDGNVCDVSYVLNAIASAGTGSWSQVSGPVTGTTNFMPITSPVSIASITIYGTYVYLWMEINGTCSDSDMVTVTYGEQPNADAGPGGTECDLDFTLDAQPSITGGYWSQLSGPGTSIFADSMSPNATVTVSVEGTYVFVWTEGSGTCIETDDITVTFSLLTTADAGPDTSVSLGNSVTLNGQGGIVYSWTPDDSTLSDINIPDPIASPLVTTTYYMTISDANGCFDIDTVVVDVLVDFNFIVSNIMTPNGDGYNDMWYIDNIEFYPDCDLAIYNRYGYQLYSTTGYKNDWDGKHNGKDLPDGTYYYVLKCPGTSNIFKGAITIFRRN